MDLITTVAAFRAALEGERAAGRSVGLVPTMGALHDGHLSLMRRAKRQCDVVAATVFVNPLQFGPKEDLDAYPRDLEGDAAKAKAARVKYVFAPSPAEMFPTPPLTTVHVAELGDEREGASRPGHFDGVATIVAKLFAVAGPCRAYFGEKDYQQLEVVRRLAADLSLPVEVVACPTVREPDGLALSSRNAYLSPDERAAATVLYRALQEGKKVVERQGDLAIASAVMATTIAHEPLATFDYADAVPEGVFRVRLFVAARIGSTRLIDNMEATLP
ncbi:MAG TPA: pantoate--beta-alanine ligase [Acidimicrobiales bacterium]|nr:pantoate--beta-alanine ligase [Acidimicrobiales bacterium]